MLGLGEHNDKFYEMPVPSYSKTEGARIRRNMLVFPPHECLHKEAEVMDHSIRPEDWPPMYTDHPVYRASDGRALLVAAYLDGVPFTKHDTVLGVFVYFMHTQTRHLVAIMRKSLLCACGCRGWCSLYELFRLLHWSFAALAVVLFPQTQHDGTEWKVSDSWRASMAGKDLVARALVCCKGDWSLGGYANVRFERVHVRCVICSHGLLRSERVSNHSRRYCTRALKRNSCPPHRSEYCNTLGFPTWSSTQHPCILCDCRRENMHVMDGFMPQSFPHTLRGYAHLDRACSAAEVPITLTDDLKGILHPASNLIRGDSALAPKGERSRKRFLAPRCWQVTGWSLPQLCPTLAPSRTLALASR